MQKGFDMLHALFQCYSQANYQAISVRPLDRSADQFLKPVDTDIRGRSIIAQQPLMFGGRLGGKTGCFKSTERSDLGYRATYSCDGAAASFKNLPIFVH